MGDISLFFCVPFFGRVELEEYSDSESNSSLSEEPYRRGVGVDSKLSMQARPTRTSLRNQGAKRPDKAIYVPRGQGETSAFSFPFDDNRRGFAQPWSFR